MLTVTIDQSEGISGADIPEQAVKKMRTGSAALSLPCLSPALARFSHFLLLNDFPPPSRSLEQVTVAHASTIKGFSSIRYVPCRMRI